MIRNSGLSDCGWIGVAWRRGVARRRGVEARDSSTHGNEAGRQAARRRDKTVMTR